MKKLVTFCTMAMVFILLLVACQPRVETVSGELQSGWKKTTIPEVESLLGVKLPVPTYLPSGYGVKEVYYGQGHISLQITDILLLISDQPIEWTGNQYTCRLALEIGWNEAGLGLKMPWAEYIDPDDYDGHIFCHECNLLLYVKMESSKVKKYKVVEKQKINVQSNIILKSSIPRPDYSKK
jgi:hypothetical protein